MPQSSSAQRGRLLSLSQRNSKRIAAWYAYLTEHSLIAEDLKFLYLSCKPMLAFVTGDAIPSAGLRTPDQLVGLTRRNAIDSIEAECAAFVRRWPLPRDRAKQDVYDSLLSAYHAARAKPTAPRAKPTAPPPQPRLRVRTTTYPMARRLLSRAAIPQPRLRVGTTTYLVPRVGQTADALRAVGIEPPDDGAPVWPLIGARIGPLQCDPTDSNYAPDDMRRQIKDTLGQVQEELLRQVEFLEGQVRQVGFEPMPVQWRSPEIVERSCEYLYRALVVEETWHQIARDMDVEPQTVRDTVKQWCEDLNILLPPRRRGRPTKHRKA